MISRVDSCARAFAKSAKRQVEIAWSRDVGSGSSRTRRVCVLHWCVVTLVSNKTTADMRGVRSSDGAIAFARKFPLALWDSSLQYWSVTKGWEGLGNSCRCGIEGRAWMLLFSTFIERYAAS